MQPFFMQLPKFNNIKNENPEFFIVNRNAVSIKFNFKHVFLRT